VRQTLEYFAANRDEVLTAAPDGATEAPG